MNDRSNPHVHVYEDLESLSLAVAQKLVALIEKTVRERGRFTLALSGGSTPCTLYRILAEGFRDTIPWNNVHLFWGDERFVPVNHPDSNFALVNEYLISRITLPPANIHRVPVESDSPEEAADAYEEILKAFFEINRHNPFPSFDLVLLGVGADGHTASLFPGSPTLLETKRLTVAGHVPENIFPRERITVTLPVINNARFVFFLVSGAGKKQIVQLILNEPETARESFPAAKVISHGHVSWWLDKYAAGIISNSNKQE